MDYEDLVREAGYKCSICKILLVGQPVSLVGFDERTMDGGVVCCKACANEIVPSFDDEEDEEEWL